MPPTFEVNYCGAGDIRRKRRFSPLQVALRSAIPELYLPAFDKVAPGWLTACDISSRRGVCFDGGDRGVPDLEVTGAMTAGPHDVLREGPKVEMLVRQLLALTVGWLEANGYVFGSPLYQSLTQLEIGLTVDGKLCGAWLYMPSNNIARCWGLDTDMGGTIAPIYTP